MNIDWLYVVVFALATTFTPGPNNIIAAAFGLKFGYRKSLNFLLGIALGFFFVIFSTNILIDSFNEYVYNYLEYLQIAAALYILYLGINMKTTETGIETNAVNKFIYGLILQFINPKLIFYGITLYTIFFYNFKDSILLTALFSVVFALLSFTSISLWSIGGNWISNRFYGTKKYYYAMLTAKIMLIAVAVYMFLESFSLL